MKKALIIGAGMGGLVPAMFLQKKGWNVTIIERDNIHGGGVRTFFHGGHPYTLGPRHFLSPYPEAYEFLNQYVPMRDLTKISYTYMDQDKAFYTYPIHEDDIPLMPEKDQIYEELEKLPQNFIPKNFEELWVSRVGQTLFGKYIRDYNKKAWMIDDNKEMDHGSGIEITVKRHALEKGARHEFKDWFNCYPIALDGYNKFFDIAIEGCNLMLNTNITGFDVDRCELTLETGEKLQGDILISTLSPDLLLEKQFGELRYVGREFYKFVLPLEFVLPENVYQVYYPSGELQQTRIVEYKKFSQYKSPHTLLSMEVPSMSNKLYPMLIKKEVDRAQKYLDALPDNVYSMGRMGKYRYIDVDDIIMDTLEFIKNV